MVQESRVHHILCIISVDKCTVQKSAARSSHCILSNNDGEGRQLEYSKGNSDSDGSSGNNGIL